MKILNFHQSGLSEIDEESADWENLSFFDLSHNPLKCDCGLEWLRKLTQNKPNLPRIKCDNQDLPSLSDLCAETSQFSAWAIVGIIFSVLVLIVIVIFLVWYFMKRKNVFKNGGRRLKRPKSLASKADIVVIPDVPEDLTKYRDVEHIYEDPAEIPLGSAQNYPDIKTTVL